MHQVQNNIITQLQKDILSLQGFNRLAGDSSIDFGLGSVDSAFPNKCFPTGAIHEFISNGHEDNAASGAFITGLLSTLMKDCRVSVWIHSKQTVFPPALKSFGVEPDKIIFIHSTKEKEMLWVMEEALKCEGIAAVIGEIPEISFTASRRLQLAVEQSRVTGFILRNRPRNLHANACVARWKISSLPCIPEEGLPGIGFPRWNIELLKIRNGKPGTWQLEWSDGRFHPVVPFSTILPLQRQRKTG
ncbi:MAG: Error-prone repair protein ImuA [Bacteroidota bacterium]